MAIGTAGDQAIGEGPMALLPCLNANLISTLTFKRHCRDNSATWDVWKATMAVL